MKILKCFRGAENENNFKNIGMDDGFTFIIEDNTKNQLTHFLVKLKSCTSTIIIDKLPPFF